MITLLQGDVRRVNIHLSAFLEDLNLVFLTAAITLGFAVNAWIFVPAAALELIYLAVFAASPWYRAHAKSSEDRDIPLLALMVVGTFIITIFGFGIHRWFPSLTHSQSWEFGALSWTGVFAFYYWFRLDSGVNDKALKFAGLFVLLFLPLLNISAGYFLWRDRQPGQEHSLPFHFLHVICVGLIGVLLLITDWMLARTSRTHRQKRQMYESVWMADVPIVVAFVVLISFAALHLRQDCGDRDCPDLLLSGAITFQLIASNVMFILLQFDVLERMRLRIQAAAAATA